MPKGGEGKGEKTRRPVTQGDGIVPLKRGELVELAKAREPDWEHLRKVGLELGEDRCHVVAEFLKRLYDPLPMMWFSC